MGFLRRWFWMMVPWMLASTGTLAAPLLECPFHLLRERHSDHSQGVVREFFTRTFSTHLGPYHEIIAIYETDGPGRFRSRSVRRWVRPGLPKDADGKTLDLPSFPNSEDAHYALIKPVVDANLAKYELRRSPNLPRGWPEEVVNKLRETTRNTINHTIYQWAYDPQTGAIVSGVRVTLVPTGERAGVWVPDGPIVHSLYGPVSAFNTGDGKTHDPQSGLPLPLAQVPDLKYLGIEVPRPTRPIPGLRGGEIPSNLHFGVGGLFIEETLPGPERDLLDANWKNVIASLAQGTSDPGFNYYAQNFLFMLDPISSRAYRSWEYQPIRSYVRDGQSVQLTPGDRPPTIRRDHVEWLPAEWFPERVEGNVAALHEGKIAHKSLAQAPRPDADILFSSPEVPYPFTTEPASEIKSLMQKLAVEPQISSERVFDQLRRKIELLDVHWREWQRNDPATRERARHNYEMAKTNVAQIESTLRDLARHPDEAVRKRVLLLVGSLMEWNGREPGFLRPESIAREYFPLWVVDESEKMRNRTLYLVATYPEFRKMFGQPDSPPDASRAITKLKTLGLNDQDATALEDLARATVSGRGSPQDLVKGLERAAKLRDRHAAGLAVLELLRAVER